MADSKIKVKVFKGKCPFGGCETKQGPRKLGKHYEDAAEIRRRVYNHCKFSSYHTGMFDNDDALCEQLDGDVEAWLITEEEEWDQNEFDEMMASGENEGPQVGVPEPVKGGSKGEGKSEVKQKGRGGGKLEHTLQDQIRRQTQNMMHFTKAASTCISALKLSAQISRDAASAFDRERQNMEEGCEEMIAAFGLQPRPWQSRGENAVEILHGAGGASSRGARESYPLANAVRKRGGPY